MDNEIEFPYISMKTRLSQKSGSLHKKRNEEKGKTFKKSKNNLSLYGR